MPMVSIVDLNQTFEVSSEEPLFNSLLKLGVELPHGCLAGSCGACRVEVIQGKENLSPPSFIEADTTKSLKEEFKQLYGPEFVDKEIRLSCRAKVLGDITIKFIK